MKNSSSYHKWLFIALCALAILLIGCERQAPQPDMTATPADSPAATLPVLPTMTPTAVLGLTATVVPTNTVPTVPPPAATATTGSGTGQTVHVVVAGDTLNSISQRYGVPADQIMAANSMTDPNTLVIGTQLIIPVAGTVPPATQVPPTGTEQVYTVQAGDNLFRIGLNYGCTVDQLSVYNNIPAPYIIYPGQQIRIPPNC